CSTEDDLPFFSPSREHKAGARTMASDQVTPTTFFAMTHQPPPFQSLPAVVDRYRLLRPLAWGGTGIVCEAEDSSLRRRVAIKLIPQDPSPGEVPPDILREAQLASEIQHSHVVALYATGTYPGGVYLVMELVQGRSVQSLLADGPLPWRKATGILVAACE